MCVDGKMSISVLVLNSMVGRKAFRTIFWEQSPENLAHCRWQSDGQHLGGKAAEEPDSLPEGLRLRAAAGGAVLVHNCCRDSGVLSQAAPSKGHTAGHHCQRGPGGDYCSLFPLHFWLVPNQLRQKV